MKAGAKFGFFLWTFLFIASTVLSAQPANSADWFKFKPGAAAKWQISFVSTDGSRIIITQKNPSEAASKKVLVLFPKASSAYDTAMETILNVFYEKNVNAEFTLFYFQEKPALGKMILSESENSGCALVISMGSTSTSFLHDNYLGGKLPVVTVCSKDPVLLFEDIKEYTKGNGTNIAYTSLDIPIALQIDYMFKLIPGLQNIAILYDVKNTSAVQTQVLPLKAQSNAFKLNCFDVAVQDPKKAREELARLVPAMVQTLKNSDPELKRSIFWITGSTSVFNEMETINRYADKIPVLSVVADVITDSKYKALLSIGVSFSNNALIAALYAIRVITGEVKAGDLPVGVVSPPDIAINFNKARELGLKIPFEFFESAAFVCDYAGVLVRDKGQKIKP